MQDTNFILIADRKNREQGLTSIPCQEDKRPVGSWSEFQERQLSEEEFKDRLTDKAYGIAVICGGSTSLEVIDIDQKYDVTGLLAHRYFSLINDNCPDLFDRLYIVKTVSGGYHIYYRCNTIAGNMKLAQRPPVDGEKEGAKVLIETRGKGGLVVAPPTPGYEVWQEKPIPAITEEERGFLLDAARSFNEVHTVHQPTTPAKSFNSPYDEAPWDAYNNAGDISELLQRNGWTRVYSTAERDYWRRPGKSKGISADYHKGKRLFKCWSTSQGDFEPEKAYTHTAVLAFLEYRGDFIRTTAELERIGYGKKKDSSAFAVQSHSLLPASHPTQTGDKDYAALFARTILDQSRDYPLPFPIISLRFNGESFPMLTLKSFSLWHGRQKSFKSVSLAIMAAAFIRHIPTTDEIYFEGSGEGTALWFDCEQGESYAARTMKLILKLAGLDNSERLKYCDLRGYTPSDRINIMKAGIDASPNVKLVIVDGLVDLMNDFTDPGEAHQLITEILSLCSLSNIHVAVVLHQNKADKNPRHHIGTIASQKCELEISMEKDQNDRSRSIVNCVSARGLPFEDFAIRWDKGLLPCIDTEWHHGLSSNEIKTTKKYNRDVEIAEAIFRPTVSISHTEAINRIVNSQTPPLSESTAKRRLKDYINWRLVEKGDDGNYRRVQGSRGSNGVQLNCSKGFSSSLI